MNIQGGSEAKKNLNYKITKKFDFYLLSNTELLEPQQGWLEGSGLRPLYVLPKLQGQAGSSCRTKFISFHLNSNIEITTIKIRFLYLNFSLISNILTMTI